MYSLVYKSDNGTASPISNGSLTSPLNEYVFYSQKTFSKVDGQYAIVYIVTDRSKSSEFTIDYNRSKFSMYLHFIKDSTDQSSEQILLYQYYDSPLIDVFLTDCEAGFNSLGLQSNICFLTYITLDAMEYIKFVRFSSSGSIIQEGFLSTRSNTSFQNTIVESVYFGILPYGGAIEFNFTYYNSSLYNFSSILTLQFRSNLNTISDILFQTINANLVSQGIFDNNTIWVVYSPKVNTFNNSKITTIDMEHIYNDYGYENVAILSSYPTLNMTISLSYNSQINITLYAPIVLSAGNISIYQTDNSNNLLLPLLIKINSDYMIIVDDNFVRALSFNEPFYGIKQGVWQVTTPKSYNSKVSDSTQAILRLNSDGFSYFSNYNETQFDDLLQQIKESIPLMNDRLQITHNIQPDPSDFSKLLIEFSISKANDPLNEPSVDNIINDLEKINI
ncbi:16401_t:CDS:2 [Dentiscutata erythropus]|uniref:16401_t:CDS:1 n=1 Tax=Dentiscutata erythropus TaxID=1348616 RepID=A0A9N9G4S6_9GLOM|nr:16401_t:CDS:2 [Dentiscutata erythropus]